MKRKLPKRSNTFGITAILLALSGLLVPPYLLIYLLVVLTPLIAVSFLWDRYKSISVLATLTAATLLYLAIQEKNKADAMYQVKYEVNCKNCDIEYVNAIGNIDRERNTAGIWIRTTQVKGDSFVHVRARSNDSTAKVLVVLFVNDIVMGARTATGDYATASVSCRPEDVNGK